MSEEVQLSSGISSSSSVDDVANCIESAGFGEFVSNFLDCGIDGRLFKEFDSLSKLAVIGIQGFDARLVNFYKFVVRPAYLRVMDELVLMDTGSPLRATTSASTPMPAFQSRAASASARSQRSHRSFHSHHSSRRSHHSPPSHRPLDSSPPPLRSERRTTAEKPMSAVQVSSSSSQSSAKRRGEVAQQSQTSESSTIHDASTAVSIVRSIAPEKYTDSDDDDNHSQEDDGSSGLSLSAATSRSVSRSFRRQRHHDKSGSKSKKKEKRSEMRDTAKMHISKSNRSGTVSESDEEVLDLRKLHTVEEHSSSKSLRQKMDIENEDVHMKHRRSHSRSRHSTLSSAKSTASYKRRHHKKRSAKKKKSSHLTSSAKSEAAFRPSEFITLSKERRTQLKSILRDPLHHASISVAEAKKKKTKRGRTKKTVPKAKKAKVKKSSDTTMTKQKSSKKSGVTSSISMLPLIGAGTNVVAAANGSAKSSGMLRNLLAPRMKEKSSRRRWTKASDERLAIWVHTTLQMSNASSMSKAMFEDVKLNFMGRTVGALRSHWNTIKGRYDANWHRKQAATSGTLVSSLDSFNAAKTRPSKAVSSSLVESAMRRGKTAAKEEKNDSKTEAGFSLNADVYDSADDLVLVSSDSEDESSTVTASDNDTASLCTEAKDKLMKNMRTGISTAKSKPKTTAKKSKEKSTKSAASLLLTAKTSAKTTASTKTPAVVRSGEMSSALVGGSGEINSGGAIDRRVRPMEVDGTKPSAVVRSEAGKSRRVVAPRPAHVDLNGSGHSMGAARGRHMHARDVRRESDDRRYHRDSRRRYEPMPMRSAIHPRGDYRPPVHRQSGSSSCNRQQQYHATTGRREWRGRGRERAHCTGSQSRRSRSRERMRRGGDYQRRSRRSRTPPRAVGGDRRRPLPLSPPWSRCSRSRSHSRSRSRSRHRRRPTRFGAMKSALPPRIPMPPVHSTTAATNINSNNNGGAVMRMLPPPPPSLQPPTNNVQGVVGVGVMRPPPGILPRGHLLTHMVSRASMSRPPLEAGGGTQVTERRGMGRVNSIGARSGGSRRVVDWERTLHGPRGSFQVATSRPVFSTVPMMIPRPRLTTDALRAHTQQHKVGPITRDLPNA